MTVLHSDAPRAVRSLAVPRGAATPALRFTLAAFIGAAGVALVSMAVFSADAAQGIASVLVYLCAAALAGAGIVRSYPHDALGMGNLVTLLRLVLTAPLVVPLLTGGAMQWQVFALAAVALSLDGVDGWLARKQRLTSAFGARFDMEVDAGLGLLLALNAFAAGTAGPAVLLLGAPRYVFVALGLVLPWLARPLPDSLGRKLVCVIQIGVLIGVQPPIVPGAVAATAITIATLALIWSFGRDTLWLWRQRA
ncbi:MAG: CDP-alcohol phosphatidyltransferase family protein [Roseovarius sp.]